MVDHAKFISSSGTQGIEPYTVDFVECAFNICLRLDVEQPSSLNFDMMIDTLISIQFYAATRKLQFIQIFFGKVF